MSPAAATNSARAGYAPLWVRLKEFHFDAVPPSVPKPGAKLTPPDFEMSARATIDKLQHWIQIDVRFGSASPAEADVPFSIKGHLAALFRWDEPLSLDPAAFAQKNAIAILWPYCREMVWNMTARAGYPPLFLPIMSFASAKTEVVEGTVKA